MILRNADNFLTCLYLLYNHIDFGMVNKLYEYRMYVHYHVQTLLKIQHEYLDVYSLNSNSTDDMKFK